MHSAVLTETDTAEAIFAASPPPCEIDADGTPGSGCPQPSAAKVLCWVLHFPDCPDVAGMNKDAWMCREHLVLARTGAIVCSLCEAPVRVIRQL